MRTAFKSHNLWDSQKVKDDMHLTCYFWYLKTVNTQWILYTSVAKYHVKRVSLSLTIHPLELRCNLVRPPSCDQVSRGTCDLKESHNTNQRRNNQSPHPQICINIAINICTCLDLWQHSHLHQEHLSLFPILWFVNIVENIKCDVWSSAINIEHPSVAV